VDAVPDVLKVNEAARLLRVDHKTLRDAINRSEVPGVIRIGRVIRLDRAALLAWFRKSSPAPASGARDER